MALISGEGYRGGSTPYARTSLTTGKSPQILAMEARAAQAAAERAAEREAARQRYEAAQKAMADARAAQVAAQKADQARREALRAAGAAEAASKANAARQAALAAAEQRKGPKGVPVIDRPGVRRGPLMDQNARSQNPLVKAAAQSADAGVRAGAKGGKQAGQAAAKKAAATQKTAEDFRSVDRAEKQAQIDAGRAVGRAKFLDPNSAYGKTFKTLDEWAAESAAASAGGRYVGMVQTDEAGNVTFDQSKLPIVDTAGYNAKTGMYFKNPFQGPEYQEKDVWRYGQSRANDAKWMAEWRQLTLSLGLIDDSAIITDEWGAADAEVMGWAMEQVNTTKYTDPIQFLQSMKASGYGNPAVLPGDSSSSSSGGGGGSGGSGDTLTQSVFNKTGLEDGRAILRQQMRQLLGREPSDGEVSQYVAALNAVESKTPQVTTVTSTPSGTTTRVMGNAPNPDEWLRRQVETGNAQENRDYEGSQYYDVIASLITGGGL